LRERLIYWRGSCTLLLLSAVMQRGEFIEGKTNILERFMYTAAALCCNAKRRVH
jgi:hypothetical protein